MVTADNGSDLNFNDLNQLGTGGSGVVHVYGDAGIHYLTITGELLQAAGERFGRFAAPLSTGGRS